MDLTEEQKALYDACTPLQRRVVLALVSTPGISNTEAYRIAGGRAKTDHTARACVAEILAQPSASAFRESFTEALRTREIDQAVMSRDEALGVLSAIGRAKITDIADFMRVQVGVDDKDRPIFQSVWVLKDSDDLDGNAARIISEVSAGRDGLKFKTHSQLSAIKQLAEMEGWNAAQKLEHTGADGGPIQHTELTYEQLQDEIKKRGLPTSLLEE